MNFHQQFARLTRHQQTLHAGKHLASCTFHVNLDGQQAPVPRPGKTRRRRQLAVDRVLLPVSRDDQMPSVTCGTRTNSAAAPSVRPIAI